MYAVILAAGKGERLKPHTDRLPKPMVEVGGRPILEYQIRQLKEAGAKGVVIAERFFPEAIQKHFGNGAAFGIKIDHLVLDPQNTPGSAADLKEATKLIPQHEREVIVWYGDILCDLKIGPIVRDHKQNLIPITLVTTHYQEPYGHVITNQDGIVTRFEEKPTHLVNTGIYVFYREAFAYLPTEGDLAHHFLSRVPINIRTYLHEGYWKDVADESDLLKARADFENGVFKIEGPQSTGKERE